MTKTVHWDIKHQDKQTDKKVWTNSDNADQTSPEIAVKSVSTELLVSNKHFINHKLLEITEIEKSSKF